MSDWNNHKIVEGCVNSDAEARKTLYDKYSGAMYSICLRYANNNDDAQDIFQQSFYLIYLKISQLKNPDALSGWIKRIFINTALEFNRKNIQLKVVNKDDDFQYNEISIDNDALDDISTQEITSYIQKLPKGCREVFNLYVIDGFSHKEIAEKLEVTVGTSKSQLFEARKILKLKIIQSMQTALAK